ncbi:MAG TPA: TetR/AcrR family transcriptional regulator [Acidimicrobiales bacterium]|nr:TetR/AcrR family transcriptional regulator [Acidimicrobiales bacterium]
MSAADVPTRRIRPGKVAILRAAVEVMGEDGYEGASIRDMAARAGVSVAALYYHFPSKLDLLHEFLDESYDVVLARVERRLDELVDPTAVRRLDEVVATLIASVLHDEFARLAANVAWREYDRLPPVRYRTVAAKRARLLDVVESVVVAGVDAGDFAVDEPREAARAIITLATTLVEPFDEIGRPLPEVIALYQRFARALARAGS